MVKASKPKKLYAGVSLDDARAQALAASLQHVVIDSPAIAAAKLQTAVIGDDGCCCSKGTVLDSQVAGNHYKKLGEYQPWQVMAKWLNAEELKGFMKGTVCAYLCREDDKGQRSDIEKALHTMQLYLEVSA